MNPDTMHPYEQLTPDCILDAVESLGLIPDGSLLALNSYENRVYQIRLNEGDFVIGKFYRPERWPDEAIAEEHAFSLALADADIPVVPPMQLHAQTLHRHAGFRFALFPRQGGRTPELDQPDTLEQLGRLLGRMHALGAQQPFRHRPTLNVQLFGHDSLAYLLEQEVVAEDVRHNYRQAAEQALQLVSQQFEAIMPRTIRLHGDCHPGNLLWTDNGAHFVDLDDCRMGPAIQDLWMLLSGSRDDMGQQMRHILKGYHMFFEFDPAELHLIEALRTLRLLHYSAWLARRWNDPAFPQHFPWFGSPHYWEQQMVTLREQIERLQQPVITLS